MDAADYHATATLRSGRTATIRAIRPGDKELLVAAFKNLEPETIFTRFFYHKRTLTPAELKAATEIDFETAVALVATIEEEGKEILIASGRYAVLDPEAAERSAEVAFTVEEDFQRQGLAGLLLQHLAAIARERGLAIFVAEVLPQNRGMLTVFERSGLPVKKEHKGDVVHVTLSLKAE
jgi:GNAT superfamily N-acetyltransferase